MVTSGSELTTVDPSSERKRASYATIYAANRSVSASLIASICWAKRPSVSSFY
ncbi:hypothetical protein FH972_018012 [Carpinus fangiana]|uniref:Uncharacterized protein n=1 Tax=Carpinus fangiana TaxID=176857 RepID=A0A5N6RKW8_9ROSI|nr:hypothetical protein FH972_018012 [Carpinus fangiana]